MTASARPCRPQARRTIKPNRLSKLKRPVKSKSAPCPRSTSNRRPAHPLPRRPCSRLCPILRRGLPSPRRQPSTSNCPPPPRAQEQPREKLQERPQERPQEKPQEKAPGKKRKSPGPKPSRAPKDPPGALAQALETIPRTLRLARGQIVEIRLGKEQAGQLFARPGQRPQQGGEAIRAVSVRLSAPEGGFFIETMTPETQWLLNRPGTAGEEPFGSWSWAVVPNETGRQTLAVSVSVRDIDANGVLTGSQVAEELIKIRVGANLGRFLGA